MHHQHHGHVIVIVSSQFERMVAYSTTLLPHSAKGQVAKMFAAFVPYSRTHKITTIFRWLYAERIFPDMEENMQGDRGNTTQS